MPGLKGAPEGTPSPHFLALNLALNLDDPGSSPKSTEQGTALTEEPAL